MAVSVEEEKLEEGSKCVTIAFFVFVWKEYIDEVSTETVARVNDILKDLCEDVKTSLDVAIGKRDKIKVQDLIRIVHTTVDNCYTAARAKIWELLRRAGPTCFYTVFAGYISEDTVRRLVVPSFEVHGDVVVAMNVLRYHTPVIALEY